MSKAIQSVQGWGVPLRARSAHYFVNATSLCGSWMYTGELEDDKHEHPDNCITCMRKRLEREAAGGAK